MKYYIIAGEASGDLHASHLIKALKETDPQAQFRGFGGDLMQATGAQLVRHYKELAYMGLFPVLMHLPTILAGMRQCKADIVAWQADALILVDYPGFNLKIAKYIKQNTSIPVYYYISPKIWAWKEGRIRQIRRDVDRVLSILPFEVDYFRRRHQYEITYVGNPSADEIAAFRQTHPHDWKAFTKENNLSGKPIIALLAGSRKQEIKDNLPRMIQAAAPFSKDYELVLAAAPGFDDEHYGRWLGDTPIRILHGQTFRILQHSTAALVTSGTATLETALFGVPQVVCYYIKWGKVVSWVRSWLLKIPYISLVNLIANAPVVPELVAEQMNVKNVHQYLAAILPGGKGREAQLAGYERMNQKLGELGAPQHAANYIVSHIYK